MYRCEIIDYSPKTEVMAERVEKKCNEMVKEGYELVTFSITNSARAILVFRKA